ncbi:restriction endonuclease subunit S [Streptomyces sp. NPDC003720]|uniref:restriction endonuclease subunit S n=1 Tax=Streptomyces sp. NPDC003720 TaxID=3364684 RepID=UPI0036AA8146
MTVTAEGWIEGAPAQWKRGRIKNLIASASNGTWGGEPAEDGSDVRCIRAADFDRVGRRAKVDGAPLRSVDESSLRQHLLHPGDLILEKSGGGEKQPVGMAVLYEGGEKAVCSNFCSRISPVSDVDSRFLTYVFAAAYGQGLTQSAINQTTGIQNLDARVFFSSPWAYPGLEEQRRIADFLDGETARIDALTGKRTVQLKLLAERRAALKTRCVTCSGPQKVHHPLLGDIHPDWQVLPLRRILPAINVGVVINPSHHFTEAGIPFIHGFNVREGFISQVGMKFMSSESNELHKRSRVYAGDVLVVRAGATAGRAAKVSEEFDGANCASVLILRKSEALDATYLETFINSVAGKGQVSFSQYGAAQEVISAGQVSSFSIALPPLSEQIARVAKLSVATAETAALESGLTRQVALLSERRQALITAAVTGQFDVSTASGRNVTDGVTA